jgi:hypothetical protein
MIRWWMDLWDRRERPLVQAIIRVLIAAVILFDFLEIGWLGLVETLFAAPAAGGIADPLARTHVPLLYRWFEPTAGLAWVSWGLVVASATTFGLGLGTRLSAVVLLLAYAQTAQIFPTADRGIDLLLRDAVAVLAFSSCGRALSLDARLRTGDWRGDGALVPAWPRHLLVLQLVVVYAMAGVQKVALSWWPAGGLTALHVVLQDPTIGRFDPAWLDMAVPLTRLGTLGTILFEWSAPLILLVFWFRATSERPGGRDGRARRLFARIRFRECWAAVGVALHLGIAVTMNLGVFPFGMLALYPALFHPDEVERLLSARARRQREESEVPRR